MPFPWKKVRSTTISQMVNDHLHHSQRRRDGSSLVVETGFPTSLVDLFMKNREKLKKSSKKRRQSSPITPIDEVIDPVIEGSTISVPSPMISPSIEGSELQSPSVSPCRDVDEFRVVGSNDGGFKRVVSERGNDRDMDANGVLLMILKMFFVVVLVLGAKRLTMGITVSAFLLFLLEYAGKHVYRFLKPCSETKQMLMLTTQRVWKLLRFNEEDSLDEKSCVDLMSKMQKDERLEPDCSSPKSSVTTRSPIREIRLQEPKIYLLTRVGEIQSEEEMIGCSNFIGSLEHQTIESKNMMEKEESFPEMAESKRKKSKKSKLKSKMKKFVPKKLKKSRKEHDREINEIIREGGNVVSLGEVLEVDQWESESATASELSSISNGRSKDEDCTSSICAFSGLSEVDEKSDTNNEVEIEEIKAGQTWTYLVLCLVVLIGLIGGRVFALVLTVSWCLLLKIGEKLPIYVKKPITRSNQVS